MIIFILIIIFIAFSFFFRNRNLFKFKEKFENLSLNIFFIVLISLIVIGFLTRLDNNQDSGCLIHSKPIFYLDNILLSSISLILIWFSWKSTKKYIKSVFFIVEFAYFLAKFLYLKGGYSVGIACVPNGTVVFYDYLSILLRLLILIKLFEKQIRLYIVEITAIILISIKIFLPVSNDYFVNMFDKIAAEKTMSRITGSWTGKIYHDETLIDTIKPNLVNKVNLSLIDILASSDSLFVLKKDTVLSESVSVAIDMSQIHIESNLFNESLFFNLKSKEYGQLSVNNDSLGHLFIHKASGDSLIMEIYRPNYLYKLKLEKK